MSDLISFDSGSVSDPIYEGLTQQELYFVIQVNLLVIARLQIDDLLDTSEKIFKIQRPSQTILPLGMWRWYYGLSRTETTSNLQRLYYHTQQLLQNDTLKEAQKLRLEKHLLKSHSGVKKLIETYRNDAGVTARLRCLIEETSDTVSQKNFYKSP